MTTPTIPERASWDDLPPEIQAALAPFRDGLRDPTTGEDDPAILATAWRRDASLATAYARAVPEMARQIRAADDTTTPRRPD
jgi:hypothetical protein